jgi:hypothetical protein
LFFFADTTIYSFELIWGLQAASWLTTASSLVASTTLEQRISPQESQATAKQFASTNNKMKEVYCEVFYDVRAAKIL